MKNLSAGYLTLVLALGAACGGGGGAVGVGQPLPAFTLADLEGRQVASAALAGRPVLLAFWATWCSPCLREVPLLQRLDDERRVTVVGIALDDGGASVVRPFVARHGLRYRTLLGNQQLFERLGGFGLPHSVLLDGTMKVRAVYRGELQAQVLEGDLRALSAD